MSDTNKLKPCPFCGGKAVVLRKKDNEKIDFYGNLHYHIHYGIYCEHEVACMLSMIDCAKFYTEQKAIAAWNKRVEGKNAKV